jgi:hypothetical protein
MVVGFGFSSQAGMPDGNGGGMGFRVGDMTRYELNPSLTKWGGVVFPSSCLAYLVAIFGCTIMDGSGWE